MIVAATGHRPPKLGGYGDAVYNRLVMFAEQRLKEWVHDCNNSGGVVEHVISGMAQGWDQAFAQGAVNCGIPFIAAVPFNGFNNMWPLAAQERYSRLIGCAMRVDVISDGGFETFKLFKRNEWMVDHSDVVMALWDGNPVGGTFRCINYARSKGKVVVNLWESWNGK